MLLTSELRQHHRALLPPLLLEVDLALLEDVQNLLTVLLLDLVRPQMDFIDQFILIDELLLLCSREVQILLAHLLLRRLSPRSTHLVALLWPGCSRLTSFNGRRVLETDSLV